MVHVLLTAVLALILATVVGTIIPGGGILVVLMYHLYLSSLLSRMRKLCAGYELRLGYLCFFRDSMRLGKPWIVFLFYRCVKHGWWVGWSLLLTDTALPVIFSDYVVQPQFGLILICLSTHPFTHGCKEFWTPSN